MSQNLEKADTHFLQSVFHFRWVFMPIIASNPKFFGSILFTFPVICHCLRRTVRRTGSLWKGGAADQENISMLLATFQTVGQASCIHVTWEVLGQGLCLITIE